MKKNNATFSLVALICLGLLVTGNFAFAQGKPLEVGYPEIPEILTPQKTSTFLPDYIRYMLYFSLLISGIAAIGIVIIAGFRYVTSTGRPEIQKDAKDQIFSAFVGIAVLFGSFIILNTISSRLTTLGGEVESERNIVLYPEPDYCQKVAEPSAKNACQENAQKYASSISDFQGFTPQSLWFFNTSADDAIVNIYPQINYQGGATEITYNMASLPFTPKSMEIIWRIPGVYLYTKPEYQGKFQLVTTTSNYIGDEFNDKVRSARIISPPDPVFGNLYGYIAAIFENPEFTGQCRISRFDVDFRDIKLGNGVSSIMIFKRAPSRGEGVIFYDNKEFVGDALGPYSGDGLGGSTLGDPNDPESWSNKITSISIDGSYAAVVWDGDQFTGNCRVFTESQKNLRDQRLGQCGGLLSREIGWDNCISSFNVYSIESMPSVPGTPQELPSVPPLRPRDCAPGNEGKFPDACKLMKTVDGYPVPIEKGLACPIDPDGDGDTGDAEERIISSAGCIVCCPAGVTGGGGSSGGNCFVDMATCDKNKKAGARCVDYGTKVCGFWDAIAGDPGEAICHLPSLWETVSPASSDSDCSAPELVTVWGPAMAGIICCYDEP